MPTGKKSNQAATGTGKRSQSKKVARNSSKGTGISVGQMHIPTARQRAKDMDSDRRANSQTFGL